MKAKYNDTVIRLNGFMFNTLYMKATNINDTYKYFAEKNRLTR